MLAPAKKSLTNVFRVESQYRTNVDKRKRPLLIFTKKPRFRLSPEPFGVWPARGELLLKTPHRIFEHGVHESNLPA
jgi:hypothetical protein